MAKSIASDVSHKLDQSLIDKFIELPRVSFTSGEIIFDQGDPVDCIYVIEKGHVSLFMHDGDKKNNLSILGPGTLLGELGAIKTGSRFAQAIAEGDIELIKISLQQFSELCQHNEQLAQLVTTMSAVHSIPHYGQVIQYAGELEGQHSIISVFRLVDGRRVFATHVVSNDLHSLKQADIGETQKMEYSPDEEHHLTLLLQNEIVVGVIASGSWPDLNHYYHLVFNQETLTKEQCEQFN